MAAYHRVYDSHHLQADCEELEPAPEPYEHGLPLPFTFYTVVTNRYTDHATSVAIGRV